MGTIIIDAETHDSISFLFGHKEACAIQLLLVQTLNNSHQVPWMGQSGFGKYLQEKSCRPYLLPARLLFQLLLVRISSLLASAGTYDNNITLWDVNTRKVTKSLIRA